MLTWEWNAMSGKLCNFTCTRLSLYHQSCLRFRLVSYTNPFIVHNKITFKHIAGWGLYTDKTSAYWCLWLISNTWERVWYIFSNETYLSVSSNIKIVKFWSYFNHSKMLCRLLPVSAFPGLFRISSNLASKSCCLSFHCSISSSRSCRNAKTTISGNF